MKKKLPIGIENFNEFFSDDFYYVDKTGLIIDLLYNWSKVNLFTRPRRFGKSLNMSMLKSFFEIGSDGSIFDGLKVSQDKELCQKYMGQFPVISISLKGVANNEKNPIAATDTSFEMARKSLKRVIGDEARRLSILTDSDNLSKDEKEILASLTSVDEKGDYVMSNVTLEHSLLALSKYLEKHYGKRVIILIDEYDVPLDKAFQYGYYDEMVSLIRNLFGNALKTNDSLQFAVLTGCLRISNESIFTGLNNFNVMGITNKYFSEYFGFTEDEVRELLDYYGCTDALDKTREWYDGYRFGDDNIFCPWDVIKYCQELIKDKNAYPQNYWANTSGNDLVRRFIDKSTSQTKREIEKLISGEAIVKRVNQELTYRELDESIENLWSALFTTGYLTQRGSIDGRSFELAIPNTEIHDLFVTEVDK